MDTAVVQWDMCLSLRRETRIEDRNLGVINEELKTEIKELWITKENICSVGKPAEFTIMKVKERIFYLSKL